MTEATRPLRPSSDLLDFRAPTEGDLPDLIALQTDPSAMRFYGGVQEIENIERRHRFALEHERRFGYGLWSLYERQTGQFVGIAGVIHYNGDFNAEELEVVACLKTEAQRQGYGRHIFERLHAWCGDAGVLDRALVRVEVGHHQVEFLESYLGHPLHPIARRPSAPDDHHLFYRLLKRP